MHLHLLQLLVCKICSLIKPNQLLSLYWKFLESISKGNVCVHIIQKSRADTKGKWPCKSTSLSLKSICLSPLACAINENRNLSCADLLRHTLTYTPLKAQIFTCPHTSLFLSCLYFLGDEPLLAVCGETEIFIDV